MLSAHLTENGYIASKTAADVLSQLLSPIMVQFASTPYHLLALDLYNRKGESWASRWAAIKAKYSATTALRIARIGPAFGIGGISNRIMREDLIHDMEATYRDNGIAMK